MNNQRDQHFCALSRPKTAKWLKFQPATGRPVPSKFANGNFDAFLHKPISIKRPDSNYNRILAILAEIRASGNAWRTAEQITRLYNERYHTKKKTPDIQTPLGRFFNWHWVDYKPTSKRYAVGLYALRADVDVNDIDDLFARAESREQIFEGKKGYR